MEPLDLTPDMLLKAYAVGVFPMAEDRDDPDLFWIDPRMRGIIPLDQFHVPRRLKKTIRSGRYKVTFNKAFEAVMEGCAESTERRPRTWINDKILTLYTSLFHMGHGHSVEVWEDDILIGGLYGVSLGAAFFGESMFSRQRDASKIALTYLICRLTCARFRLLDSQFITKHLEQFGAVEIPRSRYRAMLADALQFSASFMDNYRDDEILDYLKALPTRPHID
ncbi:leucyl/phenylalanyl-tRNA--protein transferase [Aestuariispira ectoiniformans]|uniref:leucyl/phenylalanyl-tRNA--protein transferase n=1 Tax=Aestuariispira ectoiniformans TaxID=2775080 RepID=UPI00223BC790|nr:leucyl/phenylalanyl-tRNA--protein transferase [Aestuariispira ectoiniformans]